jgi:hypothetical protein
MTSRRHCLPPSRRSRLLLRLDHRRGNGAQMCSSISGIAANVFQTIGRVEHSPRGQPGRAPLALSALRILGISSISAPPVFFLALYPCSAVFQTCLHLPFHVLFYQFATRSEHIFNFFAACRCRAIDGPRRRGQGGSGFSRSVWRRTLYSWALRGSALAAWLYYWGV